MEYRCPACHALISSRRQTVCGVCEAPLPEEMRFSPEEQAKVDKAIADFHLHEKLEREAEEKKARERRDDGCGAGGYGYSIGGF